MRPEAVFLDLDGVINDGASLSVEYPRLMGDVLAPALGGAPGDWGRANAETYPHLVEDVLAMQGTREAIERFELSESVSRMCAWLGIELPGEVECFRLGREMNLYVRANGRFVLDGAADAIRILAEEFQLHTATGNASWTTRVNLDRIGVSHLFGVLCGPDLIGASKWHDLDFYARLFDAAGVEPDRAVVVDDNAEMLARARATGARTVQVHDGSGDVDGDADLVVASIVDVPGRIRRL